jgi:hypothetical protein
MRFISPADATGRSRTGAKAAPLQGPAASL